MTKKQILIIAAAIILIVVAILLLTRLFGLWPTWAIHAELILKNHLH